MCSYLDGAIRGIPLPQILISILMSLIQYTHGCLRRSNPAPPNNDQVLYTTRPPPMFEPTTSAAHSSHRQPCYAEEIAQAKCLNGGTCYAVQVYNSRDIACSCPSTWTGERCQLKFIDPALLAIQEENLRTANIAAGLSVIILVVFVILLSIFVFLRKKRKDEFQKRCEVPETSSIRPFSRRSIEYKSKSSCPRDTTRNIELNESSIPLNGSEIKNHDTSVVGPKEDAQVQIEVVNETNGSSRISPPPPECRTSDI